MKNRFFIVIIIALISIIYSFFAKDEKLVCEFRNHNGLNIMLFDFDSTSCTMNFPSENIVNLRSESVGIDETHFGFYYDKDDFVVDIEANKRGKTFSGGGSIDGASGAIKCHIVDKELSTTKDEFIAKYVSMKDKIDTLKIIKNEDGDILLNHKGNSFYFHLINDKKIILDDCTNVKVEYSKGRPYILEFRADSQKQMYFRVKE